VSLNQWQTSPSLEPTRMIQNTPTPDDVNAAGFPSSEVDDSVDYTSSDESPSPWEVTNSYTLFDVRHQHKNCKSCNSTDAATESKAIATKSATFQMDTAHSDDKVLLQSLRGGTAAVASKNILMMDEILQQEAKNESFAYANTTREKIGSSFMFCPSAHAILSPGFLNLCDEVGLENSRFGFAASTGRGRNSNDDDEGQTSEFDLNDEIVIQGGKQQEQDLSSSIDDSSAIVPLNLNDSKEQHRQRTTRKIDGNTLSEGVASTNCLLGENDPFMRILVPADAILGNDFGVSNDNRQQQPLFVELGCRVLSARVVDGVTFVGG